MKGWKKTISALLILMLVISLLAGCGAGKTNESTADETTSAATTTAEGPSTLISKEPLTLTVHMHYQDSNKYNEDLPVFKKVEELTNIKLKNVAADTATNSVEVYNLMLASGTLPDIISLPFLGKADLYMRDATDGVYMALDELIDQYAPNIKKVFDENPDIRKYMTAPDGKLYGLPFFYDLNAPEGVGWFIRNDWLKKLNLKAPTTVDEYHEVLKAFREKDPNGNGKKDEVPFFTRATDPKQLYILWNAYPSFFVENGKIKYGPLEANYKNAIVNVAQWYKEGLINPEIYTAGAASREKLLSEDVGGSSYDWFASTSNYNSSLAEKIPGFEFGIIAPPAGVDGLVRSSFYRDKIVAGVLGWAMSSKNTHPVETIKYFDFWFSEQGKMLANFGLEGEDYTMVNGKPMFTDAVMKANVPPVQYLISRGAQLIGMGTMQDIGYEIQVMHPLGKAGYDLYSSNNWRVERYPMLTYSAEDNEKILGILANVNTYLAETEQKWILGATSIENTYDEFITTLKKFGIEDVIAIQQKAYDELK